MREQRPGEIRRDVKQRDVDALLIVDREGELILGVEDRGRLVHHRHALQRIGIRQPIEEGNKEPRATDSGSGGNYQDGDEDSDGEPRVLGANNPPFAGSEVARVAESQIHALRQCNGCATAAVLIGSEARGTSVANRSCGGSW